LTYNTLYKHLETSKQPVDDRLQTVLGIKKKNPVIGAERDDNIFVKKLTAVMLKQREQLYATKYTDKLIISIV